MADEEKERPSTPITIPAIIIGEKNEDNTKEIKSNSETNQEEDKCEKPINSEEKKDEIIKESDESEIQIRIIKENMKKNLSHSSLSKMKIPIGINPSPFASPPASPRLIQSLSNNTTNHSTSSTNITNRRSPITIIDETSNINNITEKTLNYSKTLTGSSNSTPNLSSLTNAFSAPNIDNDVNSSSSTSSSSSSHVHRHRLSPSERVRLFTEAHSHGHTISTAELQRNASKGLSHSVSAPATPGGLGAGLKRSNSVSNMQSLTQSVFEQDSHLFPTVADYIETNRRSIASFRSMSSSGFSLDALSFNSASMYSIGGDDDDDDEHDDEGTRGAELNGEHNHIDHRFGSASKASLGGDLIHSSAMLKQHKSQTSTATSTTDRLRRRTTLGAGLDGQTRRSRAGSKSSTKSSSKKNVASAKHLKKRDRSFVKKRKKKRNTGEEEDGDDEYESEREEEDVFSVDDKLGTLSGVIIPTVQQILGVTFFLRLPFLVGWAGIAVSIGIIVVATSSTILTALSLSAIYTNRATGGIYKVLARILGTEVGASIGFLYFIGQAISISFYILGGVEILIFDGTTFNFDLPGNLERQLFGTILLLILVLMLLGSVKALALYSWILLLGVTLAVLSLAIGIFASPMQASDQDPAITGLRWSTFLDNLPPKLRDTAGEVAPTDGSSPVTLSLVVALFYPGVTGILNGANRAAFLINPSRSIPTGTLLAIAFTSSLYLIFAVLFGSVATGDYYRDPDRLFIPDLGWPFRAVVIAGAALSALGAALQSLITAPRMLINIANDDSIPFLRQLKGVSPSKQFAVSTLITCFISFLFVLLGNSTAVAPPVSMLLLTAYMMVNFSVFVLSVLKVPSFRPSFPYFSAWTSLAGTLIPLLLMFLISVVFAIIAIVAAVALYKYVQVRRVAAFWGDGLLGLKYETARNGLLELDDISSTAKARNWRPQILAFSSPQDPASRPFLRFLSHLKKGNGLLIVGSVLIGDTKEKAADVSAVRGSLKEFMRKEDIPGFTQIIVSSSLYDGILSLIQTAGLGGLDPNVIALGWPRNWKTGDWDYGSLFVKTLDLAKLFHKTVMIVKGVEEFPCEGEEVRTDAKVDIWWLLHDGGVLLLIPFILKKHKVWKGAKLRVFTVAREQDNSIQIERGLRAFLQAVRIDAEVYVVDIDDTQIGAYTYGKTIRKQDRQEWLRRISALNPDLAVGNPEIQEANTPEKIGGAAEEGAISTVGASLKRESSLAVLEDHRGSLTESPALRPDTFSPPSASVEIVPPPEASVNSTPILTASNSNRRLAHSGSGAAIVPDSITMLSKAPLKVTTPNKLTPAMASTSTLKPVSPHSARSSTSNLGINEEKFEEFLAEKRKTEASLRSKAAEKMNHTIYNHSASSALVLINLPAPRVTKAESYMLFVEKLTDGLDRVILLRGTGEEIISIDD